MKHYFTLPINTHTALVYPTLAMAKEIFDLIDSDREKLGQFLDFVPVTKEIKDEEAFLKMKLTGVANGTDLLYLISYQGKLVGTIDLHFVDHKNKKAEIGYWIHSSVAGKGLTSLAVQTICQIGFEDLGLNKLIIRADTENIGSNRVAQKCGFSLVGTDQSDLFMYDEFRDLNQYALLKAEFVQQKNKA